MKKIVLLISLVLFVGGCRLFTRPNENIILK